MESPTVCCPPGSWGAAKPPADYVNKGQHETLGPNLRGYIVRPSSGNKSGKAVIACPDIFGEASGRTRAICDDYAEKLDCMVILPGFLDNDEWQEGWGMPNNPIYNLFWFIPFCIRHNNNKTRKLYETDIKGFLDKEGITSFAMISFCYGALPAEALSALPGAKAHVSFHPSHSVYALSFAGSLAQNLAKVKCPQLYLVAANDQVKPGDESETTVRDVAKQHVEVHVYAKQRHGWVNRGDVSKPEVLEDVEKALSQGCDFLKKYL